MNTTVSGYKIARGADLRGANLTLCGKCGMAILGPHKFGIGCEIRTLVGWDKFFYSSDETLGTPRDSFEFGQIEIGYRWLKSISRIARYD